MKLKCLLHVSLALLLIAPVQTSLPCRAESDQKEDCRVLVKQNYALRQQGNYTEAERVLKRAEQLATSDTDRVWVFNALGGLYMHTDNSVKAEEYLRSALGLGEKLFPPDALDLASLLDNLSVVCTSDAKMKDAEAFNSKAIDIYRKHPESPNAEFDLVTVLGNRGYILSKQKRWPEAEKAYEESIAICKNSKRALPPDLYATMLDNLGSVYSGSGQLEKAEQVRVDALSLFESSQGSNHPETIKAKQNLAFVYTLEGKLQDAAALLKSAIAGLNGIDSLRGLQARCMEDYVRVQKLISEKEVEVPSDKGAPQSATTEKK